MTKKFEIQAKSGVHLISLGKILKSGEIYIVELEEKNKEMIRAEQIGLVNIKEITEKPKPSHKQIANEEVPAKPKVEEEKSAPSSSSGGKKKKEKGGE